MKEENKTKVASPLMDTVRMEQPTLLDRLRKAKQDEVNRHNKRMRDLNRALDLVEETNPEAVFDEAVKVLNS